MPKKYIVKLKSGEREQLLKLVHDGKGSAKALTHARILLKADQAKGQSGWTDEAISDAFDISVTTVERVRQKFVFEARGREVKQSHEDFRVAVIDLLHTYGFKVLNIRPGRTAKGWSTPVGADGIGWPDIYAVKPPYVIVWELKVGKDTVKPEQQAWLDLLDEFESHFVCVYRPEDWDEMVQVVEVLK